MPPRRGFRADVLDEQRIRDLKMGLLLGVAQGSAEPPRLVVIRHEPKDARPRPLGLIGKGIAVRHGRPRSSPRRTWTA
jgi:leucyl aminopeptidase